MVPAADNLTTHTGPTRYNAISRLLHWLVAGLIVAQFVLAELAERAADADAPLRQLALLANHKSVGMTILGLAVVRLIWRLATRTPTLPASMRRWERRAATATHALLYGLLFAMPLTGWLMSSASTYSVSWFGLFTFSDLVGGNPDLKELLEEVHETLARLLAALALLHVAAALKHRFVDRDAVLARMLTRSGIVVFVAIAGGTVAVLGRAGSGSADRTADAAAPVTVTATGFASRSEPEPEPDQSAEPPVDPLPEPPANKPAAEPDAPPASAAAEPAAASAEPRAPRPAPPPIWNIRYPDSTIRFVGEQAGAPFEGRWLSWTAEMRFDPDSLAASRFDVSIQADSASTGDTERDTTMTDADWFDAANHARIRFVTQSFAANGDGGFTARAELIIKGRASAVDFDFNVEQVDGARRLTGTARLDRLALGVGTGEWTDTEWVGQWVDVSVEVLADP